MINTYNAVYYVEASETDRHYNPLAIRPKFYEFQLANEVEKRCDWEDTGRGTHIFYKTVVVSSGEKPASSQPPRNFKIIGRDGQILSFTLLTREIFDSKHMNDKIFGNLTFSSDEEVQQYFLENPFPYT